MKDFFNALRSKEVITVLSRTLAIYFILIIVTGFLVSSDGIMSYTFLITVCQGCLEFILISIAWYIMLDLKDKFPWLRWITKIIIVIFIYAIFYKLQFIFFIPFTCQDSILALGMNLVYIISTVSLYFYQLNRLCNYRETKNSDDNE